MTKPIYGGIASHNGVAIFSKQSKLWASVNTDTEGNRVLEQGKIRIPEKMSTLEAFAAQSAWSSKMHILADKVAGRPLKKDEPEVKAEHFKTMLFILPVIFFLMGCLCLCGAIALSVIGVPLYLSFTILTVLLSWQFAKRTVFPEAATRGYHGAEHKAVTAHEKGLEITVENARQMSRLHVRCGTNMLASCVFMYSAPTALALAHLTPFAAVGVLLVSSYAALPLGTTAFRLGSKHRLLNWLLLPGLFAQLYTTSSPSDHQLAAAVEAMQAVLKAEQGFESTVETLYNLGKAQTPVEPALTTLDTKEADAF